MDEYIEREAAIEDFEKCNSENPKWTPIRVKTLIARQKAAYVAPVRHGRWIDTPDEMTKHKCDNPKCGFPSFVPWNYCPNCGAKKDGVSDG